MSKMKVQIRSPSLNQALEVSLEFNSTVWNLKEEIQQAHPQHPLPSNQRIIFSGKLLNNDDPLDTLLNKLGDSVVPIFHLVVKPSLTGPRQTPSSVTTIMPPSAISSNQTIQTSINNSALSTTTTSSPISNIQANNAFTNTTLYPPVLPGGYQLVVLNGQYYLAPVLVPANNNTQQGTPTFMQTPSSITTTNYIQTNNNNHFYYTQNQQEQAQQPQAQQQQQQQQAGAANRPILVRPVNAQRAASIWLALKLYFIVFLLCQGASLERILLFHAIALVMFMYQTGRLRVVVRRMRVVRMGPVIRDPPPPNPPQQQGEQNNNNLSEHSTPPPPRATTTTTTSNSSSSSSSSRTSQEPTTRLEILKRGIYMFIASFWPNYGRDPRIAQAFENEQRQA